MSIELKQAAQQALDAFEAFGEADDFASLFALTKKMSALRTAIQHAEATQPAEVTDAAIDAATSHLYHNGRPTSKEYRVCIARAILALRPVQVPMTDEQHPLMVFAIEAEMGAYQENEIPLAARKAIKAAKTYGITAQTKKE